MLFECFLMLFGLSKGFPQAFSAMANLLRRLFSGNGVVDKASKLIEGNPCGSQLKSQSKNVKKKIEKACKWIEHGGFLGVNVKKRGAAKGFPRCVVFSKSTCPFCHMAKTARGLERLKRLAFRP